MGSNYFNYFGGIKMKILGQLVEVVSCRDLDNDEIKRDFKKKLQYAMKKFSEDNPNEKFTGARYNNIIMLNNHNYLVTIDIYRGDDL